MKLGFVVCEGALVGALNRVSIRFALVALGIAVALGKVNSAEQKEAHTSIEELKQQLKTSGRHQAIRRLGEVGTPATQEILLATALGREGRGDEEWAARCYVKTLENKRDARRLLAATKPEVLAVGLLALRGEVIDEEILSDVRRLLDSNDRWVRRSALSVIMAAPRNDFPKETAQAILQSIRTASTMSFADRPTSAATDWWSEYTEAGSVYRGCVQALYEAKGVTDALLEALTPAEPGLVRDCVIIARGWRGDQTVRPELYRLAKQAELPNIRGIALNAFAFIGTPGDLPLLEEVAKSDPFRIELTPYERATVRFKREQGLTTVDPDQLYPNRLHAEELIRRIESKMRTEK